MPTHLASLDMKRARHLLLCPGALALMLCLSTGCLTTLDLSEDFSPDGSTTEDMRPRPDTPPDMQPDRGDVTPPVDTPPDLPRDMPVPQDMPDMPPVDMPVDTPPDMPPAAPGEGLIISELVEGMSGFNKIVEIYNASSRTVPLQGVHLVLLSHNMELLEDAKKMPLDRDRQGLEPGQIMILCNNGVDAFSTDDCDLLDAFVLNFNGDDRIALIHDVNADGLITELDFEMGGVIDSFGRLDDKAPEPGTWADNTYRRCDFTPYLSQGPFVLDALYETVPESFEGLGMPPAEGCSPP